jgi:hypothetical protein
MPIWPDTGRSIYEVRYEVDLLVITNLTAFLLNVVKNIAKDEKKS